MDLETCIGILISWPFFCNPNDTIGTALFLLFSFFTISKILLSSSEQKTTRHFNLSSTYQVKRF